MAKRTLREKLEKPKGVPLIVTIPDRMQKRFGKGKMLIPHPLDIDALIKKVKKGKLITQEEIRRKLSKKSKVEIACPITTGIFISKIIAPLAEEETKMGKKQVTPYWRVIKSGGSLNEKFPGGVKAQAAKLKKEGFAILPSQGKKPPTVKDFEKYL